MLNHNTRASKYHSVFSKIFFAIILSSIIPVLLANYILYKHSTEIILNQACNTNINMLDKTSKTIDLVLKQTNDVLVQLGKDLSTLDAVINPDMSNISRNSQIISNLKNISSSSEFILSIYIYAAHNNTIYSSSGGIYNIDSFFDKDWLQAYNNFILGAHQLKTRRVLDALGNEYNCITLIRNLPYQSWSKIGAVVINISEDKLYQTISGLDTKNKGDFFVINNDGDVIVHKDKNMLYTNLSKNSYIKAILNSDNGYFTQRVNGVDMLFTYTTSSFNQWKYIYTIPLRELQRDSTILSKSIFFITLLYIFLGLLLSYIISRGIYNPIKKLMKLIMQESKKSIHDTGLQIKDEYDFLGYAYNDVVDRKNNMERMLNSFKPVMKEKLFSNLILGKISNLNDVTQRIKFINMGLSLTNYIVIAIQIDGYSSFINQYNETDQNIFTIKLITVIEDIVNKKYKGVCIEAESDKVATIINYSDNTTLSDTKDSINLIALEIKNLVEKTFPFTITIGIGRMYHSILSVKNSYKEALDALKYKLYQGKNEIINIDSIEVLSEELYYYSEKEKMLINNLMIGHKEEVEVLIDELTKEITENKNISYTYVQQVFVRILNSIIELIINLGLSIQDIFNYPTNLYEQLSSKETIEEIKVWLKDICDTIINNINQHNHTKGPKNIEKIIQFIDDNISTDISLNDIAEYINLSPAYISKIFKEHLGKNYVEYLNISRVEKSKQLLLNTQLTIKEVGFKVGFNSIQTFFRTFKKFEGITPGQFREKS